MKDESVHFRAVVRMDAIFTITKRKAYTLQNWFGEIGGLDRMFTKVARWLVGGVAGRLWINAILGSLYMMKQGHNDEKAAKKLEQAEARGEKHIELEGGENEKPNNKVVPVAEFLNGTISHKTIKLEAKETKKSNLRFVD
jgi:hypothetical protein